MHCYAYSIRLLQPLSFLCYCLLQGWQRQLRGHTESERGCRGSDIGPIPSFLAASEERMLAKLCVIIGNDLHLFSMTRCQSGGAPSVIGSFHRALPKSPSGAEFAKHQPPRQCLLPQRNQQRRRPLPAGRVFRNILYAHTTPHPPLRGLAAWAKHRYRP